ncbi:MAG: WGR domain-containing protein [Pseudomonadota bacterium]
MQLFEIRLVKINPEKNQHRFYQLAVWPDLFGGFSLVREWGRIGQGGQLRFDPFPTERAAREVLTSLVQRKCRTGYEAVNRED